MCLIATKKPVHEHRNVVAYMAQCLRQPFLDQDAGLLQRASALFDARMGEAGTLHFLAELLDQAPGHGLGAKELLVPVDHVLENVLALGGGEVVEEMEDAASVAEQGAHESEERPVGLQSLEETARWRNGPIVKRYAHPV